MTKLGERLATQLAQERQRALKAAHATRRKIIGACVVSVGLVLVAGLVTIIATHPPRPASTVKSPAATTGAAPTTNVRGNLPKKLGEPAGFGSAADPAQNTFTITGITVDPPCWAHGTRPSSWHTVLLQVEVRTGGDRDRAAELGRILQPGFFSEIGPDGDLHDAWPGKCTDPRRFLTDTFGANQSYEGTIELRVPDPAGTLILNGSMDNAGGWEWAY